MDDTIILGTIQTIEETKKQILNKLSQNNDLKEKIDLNFPIPQYYYYEIIRYI